VAHLGEHLAAGDLGFPGEEMAALDTIAGDKRRKTSAD
jgi:hypothetical protein